MPQMHPGHQVIALTQGRVTALLRAAVDRHILADHVACADAHPAVQRRIKAQILRIGANHTAPTDAAALAQDRVAANPRVPADAHARRQSHRALDHRERPHHHIVGEFGLGRDQGGGMAGHAHCNGLEPREPTAQPWQRKDFARFPWQCRLHSYSHD